MTNRRVDLKLFGSVALSLAGTNIPLKSAAARTLLALLALHPDRREARSQLAAFLWEYAESFSARRSLRQTLHILKQVLTARSDIIHADRDSVALIGEVRTDMDGVLEKIAVGDIRSTFIGGAMLPQRLLSAEPYRGELFDSWLSLQRQHYETELRQALRRQLANADSQISVDAADAMLQLDPSDEIAARHLMTGFHHAGQSNRALDVYAKLWSHLDDVYDTEPSAETQALVADIKTAGPLTHPAAPKPEPDSMLRIAVCPPNSVGDAIVDSVARLVRAEITATLMRFRTFRILDGNHVTDEPTDYVLDLSVGIISEELVLLAVLTSAATGEVIWNDRWKGLEENWLATQAVVVSNLASALSLQISRARIGDLPKSGFRARAFDAWLEGNLELDKFNLEGVTKADECFRRVIALAPNASLGYSSLSRLMNGKHLMLPGHWRSHSDHNESLQNATKAIELDPLDCRAHLHRAWALCLLGEHGKAATGFRVARECNPNDPWTMLSSALGAAFGGDLELARDLSDRVTENGWTTEPFQWGFHAPIRFLCGDYEGCVTTSAVCGTAIMNVPAWRAAAEWQLAWEESARSSWEVFADLTRARWIDGETPSTTVLRDWFLSLFPLADHRQTEFLRTGLSGAAGL